MALYFDKGVAALFRSSLNLGVFWRLGTDPALHLWMGVNDVPQRIESLDDNNTVYLGAGRLMGIPDLELLINGIGDRIDFSIAGVLPEHLAIVAEDAPPVRGALCTVGIAPLDERYQPMTSIIPLWCGTADYRVFQRIQPDDPRRNAVHVISVSVGAGDTSRATPKMTSFTSATQRMISASDRFCERVGRYVQTYMVSWPRW